MSEDEKYLITNKELTPEELAERWRIKVATLTTWRSRGWLAKGAGLPFNKRGKSVTYSMSDVLDYENRNKIKPNYPIK